MRTKKFEILEHTADFKIRAFGKTKKEVFLNMLRGLAASQQPAALELAPNIEKKIKIESADGNALLVDFLSEVLYQSEINKEVYFEAEFSEFSETKLKGLIKGAKVKQFQENIKGVTHHGLKIKKRNSRWQATVLFDI